jgi:hypothetical protein
LEQRDDTLLWHDLRFGLIDMEAEAKGDFEYPFTYKLLEKDGKMYDIVQDQPANSDKMSEALEALWTRIKGT